MLPSRSGSGSRPSGACETFKLQRSETLKRYPVWLRRALRRAGSQLRRYYCLTLTGCGGLFGSTGGFFS
ncbi:MAG TPA: hypothetical protein PKH45_05335, partial [Tenuifilaceae bacterium]|nr:hypothetical protein [Tenuifilaceae bacterium]